MVFSYDIFIPVETEGQTSYQTEVASIEEPMVKICNELAPNFAKGTYGLIVGDDTSGRLPTLAIRAVGSQISMREGASVPTTVFLQSGRYIERDFEVEKQFAQRVLNQEEVFDKKTLLVTDYIKTGKTLKRLVELFKTNGVSFDIAAVGVFKDFSLNELNLPEDTRVFEGGRISEAPTIANKENLTGLKRHFMTGKIQLNRDYNQPQSQDVKPAREDIGILATRVLSKVELTSAV